MALEIHLLPPGSGESREKLLRHALRDIKGPDYSGIYYLAPTRLMVEAWKHVFHRETGGCYIPPRRMTLRQLSASLCNAFARSSILPKALTPLVMAGTAGCGMGLATLVAEFVSELKQHFPSGPTGTIRKALLEAFREQGIEDEATRRALLAMDMFEAYNAALAGNNSIDEDDIITMAAKTAGPLRIQTLFLDGFYEVTRAEELLIKALVEHAERTIATVPISDVNDDLSYCYATSLKHYFKVKPGLAKTNKGPDRLVYNPAPSMEEEVEEIARRIKASFVSGRQRDLENTLVVFPGLSLYRDTVERVFSRYGIPFEVSSPGKLSMTRPFIEMMGLLESISEDYPRLAFARFLTSPHFGKIPAKIRAVVPGICLSHGIIKGRGAWLNAFRHEGAYPEAKRLMDTLEKLKLPLNKRAYSDYIDVLIEILRKLDFRPPEGGMAGFEGLVRKIGLLDGFIPGGATLKGFIEAVTAVLGSPPERPRKLGVKVAGLYEVRGLEPRMLYMAGLKDGDIPSRPEMDFLLPDSVRKRIGLKDMKRHMHLEARIFTRLTASAGGLYLSYPQMEGDKFYLPSIFISGGEEERSQVRGVFSEEERMLSGQGPPLSSHVKEISKIKWFSKDRAFRVTDIDAYRACPRRFFIERALGLAPPEVLDYELEPLKLGAVVHRVMERLMDNAPHDLDNFTKKASAALDDVLGAEHLDAYFKALIKETFMALVPEIFSIEEGIRNEGYCFERAEHTLEAEPLRGIRLKGKVDRIDSRAGAGVEVIDYKTGSVNIYSSRVLNQGADLQLFLYAGALKAMGMRPERVGIYSLGKPGLKWFPSAKDEKSGLGIDDFITSSLIYLEETVRSMLGGDFRARPLEEQTCWNCPESPYCPFIQGRGPGQSNNHSNGPKAVTDND
jgi:RecB family exonuclease